MRWRQAVLEFSRETDPGGCLHTKIAYEELTYMVMQAERYHDLPSVETQESQWCRSVGVRRPGSQWSQGCKSQSEKMRGGVPAAGGRQKAKSKFLCHFSTQALNWLDAAHPHLRSHCSTEITNSDAHLIRKHPHRHTQT